MSITAQKITKWVSELFAPRNVETTVLTSAEISEGELHMLSLIFDRVLLRLTDRGPPLRPSHLSMRSNVYPYILKSEGEPRKSGYMLMAAKWRDFGAMDIISLTDRNGNYSKTLLIGNQDQNFDCLNRMSIKDIQEMNSTQLRYGRIIDGFPNVFSENLRSPDFILFQDGPSLREAIATAARLRISESMSYSVTGLESK